MRYLVFLSLVLCLPLAAFSQAPDTLWVRSYFTGNSDFDGWQVIETSDRCLAVIGSTRTSTNADWDIVLLKINSSGDTLWTRIFGGDLLDNGRSLREISNGGYIIAGFSDASIANGKDMILIKTDSLGNTSWVRYFGDTYEQEARSVALTPDGGYILAGWTDTQDRQDDIYIVKTDSLGHSEWSRTYGDTLSQRAWSIASTSDSGYIVSGWKNQGLLGNSQLFIMKLNSLGDTIWTRTFGSPMDDEEARSVVETSDGYIVAGDSVGPDGYRDAAIFKLDLNGNRVWTTLLSDMVMTNSVFVADSGDILATGYGVISSDNIVFAAKFNSQGARLWIKTFPYVQSNGWYGRSIIETYDRGCVYAGSLTIPSHTRIFLIKLTADEGQAVSHDSDKIPSTAVLSPNYPNPFNGRCLIEYYVPNTILCKLEIFDIVGRRVVTLQDEVESAGYHQVIWNSGDTPSGLYFYRLSSANFSETRKMLLVR
jgi:hypothetical protein